MSSPNAVVALLSTTLEAEAAVTQLQASGCDAGRLSIAGKDQRVPRHVVAYYLNDEHIRYWGSQDDYLNRIWQALSGWAFFLIPEIGPVLVAGPLATWIITALNNAPIFGGMSAVGMGLYTVGIPCDSIVKCESALAVGKQLLLVHGSAQEVEDARLLMSQLGGDVL